MTNIENQYLFPDLSKDDIHAREALLSKDYCNLRGYPPLIFRNMMVSEQIIPYNSIKSSDIMQLD